jgi:hypothetical protein
MPMLKNKLSGTLILHCFENPMTLNPGQSAPVTEAQSMNAEVQRLVMKGALEVIKDNAKVKPEKEAKADKKQAETVFETKTIKSEKNNDVVVVEKKAVEEKATKTQKKTTTSKKATVKTPSKTTKTTKKTTKKNSK